jgi:cytochrome oxidase assembly protein ShyY1
MSVANKLGNWQVIRRKEKRECNIRDQTGKQTVGISKQ